ATERPLLLLIVGHSLAFRSFYAFSKGGDGGLSTKDGVPTSVTYGFLKALLDNCKGLKPQGLVVAFDTAEPTFRHEADAAYKAHRDEAPEHFFADLANLQQILTGSLDIPLAMAPGYEADDVLGTLANRAANAGWRVRILSGDRDLFQLVDDQRDIAVLYMGGGPYAKNSGPTTMRRDGVIAKLGVTPEEVVELKALTGDSSDNIPGVKGVGPKTAITLLAAHTNLDGIYQALEQLQAAGPKAKDPKGALKGALLEKLANGKDDAYRSRHLAEILIDIPLPTEPRLELGSVNAEALATSLEELELYSLAKQVPTFAQLFSATAPEPSGAASPAGAAAVTAANTSAKAAATDSATTTGSERTTLAGEPAHRDLSSVPQLEPQLITTPEALEQLAARLLAATGSEQPVALDTETTSLNPFKAELVGIGVAWGEGPADLAYIPIGPPPPPAADLLSEPPPAPVQLPLESVRAALTPWLSSSQHPKTLQNAKYDRLILLRHGIALAGVALDTLLADYLRDANAKHGLEVLAERNFGFSPTSYSELVPKGADFSVVSIEDAAQYCGMDVHLTWRLARVLRDQLSDLGPALLPLLEQVEQPLEPVLAAMEATGIRIDIDYLKELSGELSATLTRLEAEAKAAAGCDFNLASPKQLGELLFETLGLDRKKSRKTKTGWSTDAAVLEKLEADHPVVPLVLEHRTLSKLKSTYVDALPQLVEPETGRVHTDFNQAVTATGR
ncbi:MAG: DNA polymerase, partial [Prochlorococcaceae cyanobacterium]